MSALRAARWRVLDHPRRRPSRVDDAGARYLRVMKRLTIVFLLAACGGKSSAPAPPEYDPADCDEECDLCMEDCLASSSGGYDCEEECFSQ